ncbi:leucine--tRNA ligase [Enterobacteriaceae endosymbiont of Neohaemonia nigricornis]|uniref:leucine--tRNA ligase n=1 Tax=Enterobacteriaceae endosymbiont of Neohaemonia nigricornis TaxID=2675792 RepID=UPI001449A88D|nr:leucine--tRNA ligase [Enterobacteriaceae endosymbiont of Neohaemonia nigricornis]QJC30486.1 leucine--tRNA ligase [Enterobacteriaceae endosymbiont of Neohaemonia nigricornis]
MEEKYDPHNIEKYVQKQWYKKQTFQAEINHNKKKFYCLSMLPYPSGKLHMGHVRNYTISDVIARYQRMLGKNVLHPIGWDAFGLPAEIAAIKHNISPDIWTYQNIQYMKKQLQQLGFSFDWNREITTCDPQYYRWEQWFFLKLYELGLIYKKKMPVNWCPVDKTVLANEQVHNNTCWRCDSNIEIKNMSQWFFKITSYAEELLHDLKYLNDWPIQVKKMQKNWIGKIEGFEIQYTICNTKILNVFIKDIKKIHNASFIKLVYTHPICKSIAKENSLVKDFIINSNNNLYKNQPLSSINSNLFATDYFNKNKIPIIIVNYISNIYNLQATFGLPLYNNQDNILAIKYNFLFIKTNIIFEKIKYILNDINNKKNNRKLENINFLKYKHYYRLQDWSISRQRLWGTPIPIVNLKNGNILPLKDTELPVIFPKSFYTKYYNYDQYHLSKLSWFHYNYNGQIARREQDTFDTFIESSWYYARYTCPQYNKAMLNVYDTKYWLPVDQYVGGIEHATMHLIYIRFFHKLMRDIGLVHTNEPVKKLLCQGMVLSDAFYYINNNKKYWVNAKNVVINYKNNKKLFLDTNNNLLTRHKMIKMSKSKNNGVDPQHMIIKYGADTLRLFLMFAAPPTMSLEWQESGINGILRFLQKLWKFIYEYRKLNYIINIHYDIQKMYNKYNFKQFCLQKKINYTISKVTKDININQTFNTAIASIMSLVNNIIKYKISDILDYTIIHYALLTIIKILYPFAPHYSYKLWQYIGNKNDIEQESWPNIINIDEAMFINFFNIIIQINGRKKYNIEIPIQYKNNKNMIKQIIYKNSKILEYIQNKKIIKTIFIPNKIFNIVTI